MYELNAVADFADHLIIKEGSVFGRMFQYARAFSKDYRLEKVLSAGLYVAKGSSPRKRLEKALSSIPKLVISSYLSHMERHISLFNKDEGAQQEVRLLTDVYDQIRLVNKQMKRPITTKVNNVVLHIQEAMASPWGRYTG